MLRFLKTILPVLLLFCTYLSLAQNITISGVVKERIDKFDRKGKIKKNDFDIIDISNVSIKVYTKDKTILNATTSAKGSYFIEFPADKNIYYLKFYKKGYLPKISEIDLRKLTLQDYLELYDWDFGLRKNVKKLPENIINKPFERYYFDGKNGELIYDENYSLEYDMEEGNTVFSQVEENKLTEENTSTASNRSDHKSVEKARDRARDIIEEAQERREKILTDAQKEATKKAEEYRIKKQRQADLEYESIVEEIRRKERSKIYASLKDSILRIATQPTTKTNKQEEDNSTIEDIDSKKIALYAKRQQLEIDRLKALTKEDSLVIQLREQEIASAEAEIKNAESEIQATKAELKAEHKELLLKESENENQRNIIIITALLLILILGGTIFIYKNYKEKQKSAELLQNRNEIIASKNESILSSIKYAKRIQESILPHKSIWEKNLENSFILYMPKDIVSGDFYWMHKISKDEVMFAAVDCTGHGVPGAFMSIVGYHSLHRAINEFGLTQPAKVLDSMQKSVNAVLRQGFGEQRVKDGMDIALCSYNSKTNVLQYAGAYNPLWILRGDKILETEATKQAVGMFTEDVISFKNHTIQLEKGDIFYIFSDGFADQFGGPKGKKIMSKGLKKILLSLKDLPLNKQKIELKKTFYEWMNEGDDDQVDDVCIIGVKV